MPRPTKRFDAVLFDMDGVLVDSESRWNAVRIAYAAARGRPWGLDDQHAVMGANSIQWATIMRDRLALDDVPVDRILRDVVDGVVREFRQGSVPVIPGAPDAVRRIAARWPVALASSSHAEVIAAALDLLGIHDALGAVTSSDEVTHGKPEPDVYRLAAQRLGAAPERCLVVEDSTNGILAGKAAGAYVVLIPNPTVLPAQHAIDAADAVIERIGDLEPDALPG
jgi:HAD superfamily hydrolase (TIGR01509 family)